MPWSRIIAHADMDAFYASVEQLDDPSLRGRPILVGHAEGRGVVLTASYEARPFGVGSAMPMALARRKCPQALVVPPHFERYTQVSRQVMATFANFSPDVEAISLDEAFLDMTGAEHLFGTPGTMGRRLKEAVREATGGLCASVGISGTKFVAKVASDLRKPDGLTVVRPDRAVEFLAPLPVRRLWGVGPKTEERVRALGFETVGQLAGSSERDLVARLGHLGSHLWRLSRALDPRPVVGQRQARSIGSEQTLAQDVHKREDVLAHLRGSADRIGERLRRNRLLAGGVRVRLKTASFRSMSRQLLLPTPSDTGHLLYLAAIPLLDSFPWNEPFRLVGMAAYELQEAGEVLQLDLFGGGRIAGISAARPRDRRKLEAAMDSIRRRFGDQAISRAEDLGKPRWGGPIVDFLDEGP